MKCGICGRSDLFTEVAQEPACATCVGLFNLWTPIRPEQLEAVRARLGLAEGEHFSYDAGAVAGAMIRGLR